MSPMRKSCEEDPPPHPPFATCLTYKCSCVRTNSKIFITYIKFKGVLLTTICIFSFFFLMSITTCMYYF